MDRYICIHGHFYQPPRENPWLETVEIQDSAYPYHDWNERVTAECYAPNSASRILDAENYIMSIVNNYDKISFDFGPTLLSWMQANAPEPYQAILEADRKSVGQRAGHGNAIAQGYNHIILPLANTRYKRTQIIWGIKDFEYRFKRYPEGMWLPETAVDIETVDILAQFNIKFTILSPHQALKVRKIGVGKWKDVSSGQIDPTRAYLCRLPPGRKINIFFYDGQISRAIAFEEKLLDRGEDFVARLSPGFSDQRQWPQILNVATDGETYGHHHKFGDMALAFALSQIESIGLGKLTNYGEYLEKFPPTHEVEIVENRSWSCAHGIERWRSNCGCNTGGHTGWNQEWRGPLRESLDWLRNKIGHTYENVAKEYLKDPWEARDRYIEIILDRSPENVSNFLGEHVSMNLTTEGRTSVLKLLEMQRHAMLMYTSCGWFFDELSGIETVQVMQYAGRAIQLSEEIYREAIEDAFKARLATAKSNFPEYGDGEMIYKRLVKPTMIDLKKVGIHYAVSSLFEEYADEMTIYSYHVEKEDYQRVEADPAKLAVGNIEVSSDITHESESISFSVLHFGGHALNGGVRTYPGNEAHQTMKNEIISTFKRGDLADIVRLMDNHFGMHNYSLVDLFKDRQRSILNFLIEKSLKEFEEAYRHLYEHNRALMGFLKETGIPVKKEFFSAAEFILNWDIKKAVLLEPMDINRIQQLAEEAKVWEVPLNPVDLEFRVRRRLEEIMGRLLDNPSNYDLLTEIQKMISLFKSIPVEINYWQIQNIYYKIARAYFRDFLNKIRGDEEKASQWINTFKSLGKMLSFNISSVLPEK